MLIGVDLPEGTCTFTKKFSSVLYVLYDCISTYNV